MHTILRYLFHVTLKIFYLILCTEQFNCATHLHMQMHLLSLPVTYRVCTICTTPRNDWTERYFHFWCSAFEKSQNSSTWQIGIILKPCTSTTNQYTQYPDSTGFNQNHNKMIMSPCLVHPSLSLESFSFIC